MLVSKIRSLASKAVVMGALGLSALTSAQATIVVGVWDPAYDPGLFPDLGWRGYVTVAVQPTCLGQLGPVITSTAVLPCTSTVLLEAKVQLYQISQVGQPTLETLDFTSAFVGGVTDIGIQSPGVVLGVNTGMSSAVSSSINLAKFLGDSADFTLDLDVTLGGPSIKMYWSTISSSGGVNSVDPTLSYFIPEPTGLALAAGALLALGLTRRRRQG